MPMALRIGWQVETLEGETMKPWTDDMVREYFDTHWDVTIHHICALSMRSKADVKRILMEG